MSVILDLRAMESLVNVRFTYYFLLYLSVTTRAATSQLSRPYSNVRRAKFNTVFVAEMFPDLPPSTLNFCCK